MKIAVVAAACAAGWAAVYGIVLALIHYPHETVAVAVFLVGCWVVFVDWRDERDLRYGRRQYIGKETHTQ